LATLVLETATAACSVALIDGGRVVARDHRVVGRGHAEQLVPMVAGLPDGGRARAILVDCGPGSFTGLRVGLAAARALGLGWGVPVAGYSSLALVAAAAFARRPEDALAAVLEGGHGEVFMQAFHRSGLRAAGPPASLRPDAAAAALAGLSAVGNGVHHLARHLPADAVLVEALPDAADAVLLPPEATVLPPVPLYGRAPDARPPAAR
jgi:tRNA threonylcarbamoyladenosine biosynthesis protein TsaB